MPERNVLMAYTKMTKSKFNAAKILFQSGAIIQEVADAIGISKGTAGIVKHSETFEEYQHKISVKSAAYRMKLSAQKEKELQEKQEAERLEEERPAEPEKEQPVVEHRQTVVVQASHYMLEEQKKTNELLTAISNKLAFIVDELTK